jgi:hypothetical protein
MTCKFNCLNRSNKLAVDLDKAWADVNDRALTIILFQDPEKEANPR